MIGGMLIQKKVYNRFDFIAVLLMTIGLIFFTLGDSESSPDFNTTGVRMTEMDHRLWSIVQNTALSSQRQFKTLLSVPVTVRERILIANMHVHVAVDVPMDVQ